MANENRAPSLSTLSCHFTPIVCFMECWPLSLSLASYKKPRGSKKDAIPRLLARETHLLCPYHSSSSPFWISAAASRHNEHQVSVIRRDFVVRLLPLLSNPNCYYSSVDPGYHSTVSFRSNHSTTAETNCWPSERTWQLSQQRRHAIHVSHGRRSSFFTGRFVWPTCPILKCTQQKKEQSFWRKINDCR